MDLRKVRAGNYLQYSGKLIEVIKINLRRDIVYVDDSYTYLTNYEVQPILLDNEIKFDLIKCNFSHFPEQFIQQFYDLLFKENLFLHDVQNDFEDIYGWKLEIDLFTFCLIQQSLL